MDIENANNSLFKMEQALDNNLFLNLCNMIFLKSAIVE